MSHWRDLRQFKDLHEWSLSFWLQGSRAPKIQEEYGFQEPRSQIDQSFEQIVVKANGVNEASNDQEIDAERVLEYEPQGAICRASQGSSL